MRGLFENVFLKYLREINRGEKNISDRTLQINSLITARVDSRMAGILVSHFEGLSGPQREAAVREFLSNVNTKKEINEFINSLDIDNPITEPTEIRLDRIKLEKSLQSTERLTNLFESVVGDLGQDYEKLKGAKNFLNGRNEELTEKHVSNINTGIEIDKAISKNEGGSLIDDYADTSTEMQSYINPEDG